MTTTEKEELLNRVTEQILANQTVFQFAVDARTLVKLIGNLQLALRHPMNVDSGNLMRNFTLALIEQLDPAHGDVYRLMMMGFDPALDYERNEDFPDTIDE